MTSSLSSHFTGFPVSIHSETQPVTNWLTIVIGILLILGFLGLLVWLYTSGKLQQWFRLALRVANGKSGHAAWQ